MTVKVDVSGSEVVLFAARPICCSSYLLLVLFATELSICTSRSGFVVESKKCPIEPLLVDRQFSPINQPEPVGMEATVKAKEQRQLIQLIEITHGIHD
jgi:hypothetical protein